MMSDFKLMETLLYKNEKTDVEGEFIISDETLWATRNIIAEIFGTTSQNISLHFNNILKEGELIENEVSITLDGLIKEEYEFRKKSFLNSKKGGRPKKLYNLDAIISIGYRINSKEATEFRKWSNKVLKEYLIKGFVIDKELLKKGGRFNKDYFDELLETIREIRASERRFNQKITDIYATSYDYNSKADITKEFFATVQNKLIYAVSGHTAAELIELRCDKDKKHLGLTSWKKGPKGKILASDVVISKNYLNKKELGILNRLVDGFLTIAETRAENEIPTSMEDWKNMLDSYIELNSLSVLSNKGSISFKKAREKALEEYETYRITQDREFKSDFDEMIDEIKRLEG